MRCTRAQYTSRRILGLRKVVAGSCRILALCEDRFQYVWTLATISARRADTPGTSDVRRYGSVLGSVKWNLNASDT